nr:hypothetical protein [Nonlabens ulvanivorans]
MIIEWISRENFNIATKYPEVNNIMKLVIQRNGQESISFLNLLSSLSYHDEKISLNEMSEILNDQVESEIFIYEVNNLEKIDEIKNMLNFYSVKFSVVD